MSDAAIFVVVFGGLFVLRIVAATVFFFCLVPEGDRCLNCDAPTLRVQRPIWRRLVPWIRPSWCMECGWHGLLRTEKRPATPATALVRPVGAPPITSGRQPTRPRP